MLSAIVNNVHTTLIYVNEYIWKLYVLLFCLICRNHSIIEKLYDFITYFDYT